MKSNKQFFSLIIFIFVIILSSQASANQQVETLQLKAGHPEQYIVKKGDTLWGISGIFLNKPQDWPEIWQMNSQIDNPHLIYPGDVLYLVYVDGNPYITRDKNGKRTVRLSPEIRYEELERAIPTIPLDLIAPFLSQNRVLNPGEYSASPYIVGINDDHMSAGADNLIYVMGITRDNPHKSFGIYRKGRSYKNPDRGNQTLGHTAIFLGEATLERPGNPATLYVEKSKAEILKGHRLIALNNSEIIDANFFPKRTSVKRPATIIGVLTNGRQPGVSYVGAMDVVLVDVGSDDGAEKGDVFDIYKKGSIVKDPLRRNSLIKLPNESAGNLMIFRTFKKLSYALVMDTSKTLRVGDVIKAPSE
ncbi:MAG: LysM peptidoglycan-binding domain-containing protein [gamma proteobacterium symbiont of Taylorina sp.]|nr:LysM peptidoglycan-binding domain-containing protein [gamma proteobacterium symbiont of Taylorina sp.]